MLQVGVNRPDADPKSRCDLLRGLVLGNKRHDFAFAGGEPTEGLMRPMAIVPLANLLAADSH
jgi:hypothetical protein